MKILLKILTSLFLLFNGIGAIYGGGNLMIYPDGSSISLSLDWLKYTPFEDYFIPGIILFIGNGLFSFLVFISLILNRENYPRLVIAQGLILTAWIVIQIFLIQTVYFLHIILGAVGLLLIISGWKLKQWNNPE
jgi:hypothetical protein